MNLRHIGLLRSHLLKEVQAAAADAAQSSSRSRSRSFASASASAAGIDLHTDSLSISVDSDDGSHHASASYDRPPDTAETGSWNSTPSDRVGPGSWTGTETETDAEALPGAPAGFTPALHALQSELFLEALCRTLKVIEI